MQLPSIAYLASQAKVSFLKFPFTVICGVLGSGLAIYMVENEGEITDMLPYMNALLTIALGIPLFFSIGMVVMRHQLESQKIWIFRALSFVLLILVYLSLPATDSSQNLNIPYIRYTIYNIVIHLLVAVVPFLGTGTLKGFWQYNKRLFLRYLQAVLYSGFLYGGLAIALGSLDALFDVDVKESLYFDLFIFVMGVFNTWFYVSGMDFSFDELDTKEDYPKGLKVFVQYVLIPLLTLYLLILYLYGAKIILLWDWPKGWVSYLIVCVAVLGIFNLLLIHPFGHWLSGEEWIKKFSRAYYYLLLPLLVLLFIAIGMRISDYGITINRYIILLLGIWLVVICGAFISNKLSIRFIPTSLMVVMLGASFGPWGMFSVSERSQVSRLSEILTDNGILVDGKLQNEAIWSTDSLPGTFYSYNSLGNSGKLSDSLQSEVYSIMSYLSNNHGYELISDWFEQDIDGLIKSVNADRDKYDEFSYRNIYMQSLGLEDVRSSYSNRYFAFSAKDQSAVPVGGFDYLIGLDITEYYANRHPQQLELENQLIRINYYFSSSFEIELISEKDTLMVSTGHSLANFIEAYGQESNSTVPKESLTFEAENDKMKTQLIIQSMSATSSPKKKNVTQVEGSLLIDLK